MTQTSRFRVFVSSTCYDLAQVRRDIEVYLDEAGFEGLLSDNPTAFYTSPFDHTLDACLKAVRSSDLIFLVVGGRYGHVPDGKGESITNLEYREALLSGLPVLTFVDDQVWGAKREFDRLGKKSRFTHGAVQDNRVFKFLDEVQSAPYGTWIFPFRTAQDIVRIARTQLSYLFSSNLREYRNTRRRRDLAAWSAAVIGAMVRRLPLSLVATDEERGYRALTHFCQEFELLCRNADISAIPIYILLSAVRGQKTLETLEKQTPEDAASIIASQFEEGYQAAFANKPDKTQEKQYNLGSLIVSTGDTGKVLLHSLFVGMDIPQETTAQLVGAFRHLATGISESMLASSTRKRAATVIGALLEAHDKRDPFGDAIKSAIQEYWRVIDAIKQEILDSYLDAQRNLLGQVVHSPDWLNQSAIPEQILDKIAKEGIVGVKVTKND